MELVRIRLRARVFTELVDGLGTQFKVLLVAHKMSMSEFPIPS